MKDLIDDASAVYAFYRLAISSSTIRTPDHDSGTSRHRQTNIVGRKRDDCHG